MQLDKSERVWSPGDSLLLVVLPKGWALPKTLEAWIYLQVQLLERLMPEATEEDFNEVTWMMQQVYPAHLEYLPSPPRMSLLENPRQLRQWAWEMVNLPTTPGYEWRHSAEWALEAPKPEPPGELREEARLLDVATYLSRRVL